MKKPAATPRRHTAVKARRKPSTPTQSRRAKNNRLHLLKFLPALLLFVFAGSIAMQPHLEKRSATSNSNVLAYATNVAVNDLLTGTNTQRVNNKAGVLSLNSQLMTAAQNKANDMVARNYWSHVTPDGTQPWKFITDTGYQYSSAGENLAYGFMNSADTITGWMNSPPHKANLLSAAFTEVGFGIANGSNYNNDGEETVVVAMYASPQVTHGSPVASSASVPSTPVKTTTTPAVASQPSTHPTEPTPPFDPTATPAQPVASTAKQTVSTGSQVKSASATRVSRIQILTDGNALWSATAIMASICALGVVYAYQRGLHIKRLALSGERFMIHHVHLDATVAAFIILGVSLITTSGVVR